MVAAFAWISVPSGWATTTISPTASKNVRKFRSLTSLLCVCDFVVSPQKMNHNAIPRGKMRGQNMRICERNALGLIHNRGNHEGLEMVTRERAFLDEFMRMSS